jgi:peptidoglycan/LPS O-acetylase OafA/YrhL
LAVFAVVAYHIGTTSAKTVLPGGYLGVDVFFVLSGYLITSLLIVEAQQTGRISIKNFYIRRARRLLPALFALLLVVAAVGAFWLPQQAARLTGDILASLAYVQNWWLIAENSSYFGTAGDRPPMLTHLWSLAVEEQYYLVWPLILIGFAVVRARQALMLVVVVLGVAASTVAGLMLYDPLVDPSRVYYGTDTRALAPLLGAATAIAVKPWAHRTRLPRRSRVRLDAIGVTALLVLVGISAWLRDTDQLLYQGGFLIIALLAAVVVGVAGHPDTGLGQALGTQPLRYLGERSYAIYLWHWPVCLVTRPGVDVPVTGAANAALRIAIAVLLAEISYQLIEKPIRRHGFLATLRRPRAATAVGGPHAPAGGALTASTGPRPVVTVRSAVTDPDATAVFARSAAPQRPRAGALRTVMLSVVLVAGGISAGFGLINAAGRPVAGGVVDIGGDQTLGPLPGGSPTPSAGPEPTFHPALPQGATVAFFGDSQATALMINKPANLGQYIRAEDASITGCGILVGSMRSRSGERHGGCPNWLPEWERKVEQLEPDVSVVILGAWEVFDLTLPDGRRLDFGTPEWDINFTVQLNRGIAALRGPDRLVALSLLPCYRPQEWRRGAGVGWWPERGDDDRTRHVNDLMRRATGGYDEGVMVIEPPDFCTDEAAATSTSYRYDGVHYYKPGAALYFSAILPQLLAPAQPSPSPATSTPPLP